MFTVVSIRADRATGEPRYEVVGGVHRQSEPAESHLAYCTDDAAARPERFGEVRYALAELVIHEGPHPQHV